ncbi:hypothetical protein HYFRA_00010164 [Hymenoscyphus fraxineus]|uniref:N-acetyltransferase domain-containing protein n=1 Tax=Hymenoscyphus fraxineus TaxID=746836 RepID=A0A9N9KWI6_9HELO|nr:hypothetical protein HYFRA_00010164 [Hymenoscyphus fraxineus]
MPLQILPCTDADMPRIFEIISLAFGRRHIYIDTVYPLHWTPSGRAAGASRMLTTKQQDPCARFLKAVDEDTGTIVAQAKWIVYRDTIPPEGELEGEFWESEEEKEFARLLCREYLIPRRDAVREFGGNVVVLDLLSVDPQFQRRGAGKLLMEWGTSLADDLGFPAVVESTEEGKALYELGGFEERSRWETRLPEKWKGCKRTERHIWMVRPSRKGSTA